jgi:hypothetical protein
MPIHRPTLINSGTSQDIYTIHTERSETIFYMAIAP